MREVNFARDIVYGIAHLLAIDPEEDLLKDQARSWVSAINSAVRFAWGFWEWPELEVTEERAMRQVWYADVTYAAGLGESSEFYYIPTGLYYKTIGAPPVGTLPTNATYFTEIAAADFDRHLAYDQYGKQAIDRVVSIDNTNPRTDYSALRWGFGPSGMGIDIGWFAGPTVWVTYIPRAPEFTSATYNPATGYSRGDLVLDLATGDCYRALAAGTGQALNMPGYWVRQKMPYVLAEYVKYKAASEQAGDAQMKAQWASEAVDRLKGEVDKLIGQGQVSFYRRGRGVPMLQGVSGLVGIPVVIG